MSTVVIDFETRSRCDLKTAGAIKYSEDPSTEIQCLCAKFDYDPAATFYRRDGESRFDVNAIVHTTRIVAHNAEFELAIWNNVGVKRLGWPELPLEKLDCTAARAAMLSLPRNLEGACSALQLPVNKDKTGYSLMMKLCKPTSSGLFRDEPGDMDNLIKYCLQDVEAEAALDAILPHLTTIEKMVWQLTAKINMRGARIDREGVEAVIRVLEEDGKMKLSEFQRLTGGHVMSPRQRDKLLQYLADNGVEMETLDKTAVSKAIGDTEGDLKAILEIRRSLGKASVSKYAAAIKAASADDRMRGLFMYHGAGTGRWTANRFQPHNMVREVPKNAARFFEICRHGIETTKQVIGDGEFKDRDKKPVTDVVAVASMCCRSMIAPEPGNSFFVGDFSAIEGRVRSWLAEEEWVLDMYRKGEDVYIVNAMDYFKVPREQIDGAKRQVGKVEELALGYMGWVGAFHNMAKNYGVHVSDEEAARICKAWRKSHPDTVNYWKKIGDAAIAAIREPNVTRRVGVVSFLIEEINGIPFLVCRLPSGRHLWYCQPNVVTVTKVHDDGSTQEREEINFMGVDAKTKKWGRQKTYSGCLVENITQAVARDLLAASMFRSECYGFKTVMHVHDEIVAEAPADADVHVFEEVMSQVPAWAAGLPMKVEAKKMERYGK